MIIVVNDKQSFLDRLETTIFNILLHIYLYLRLIDVYQTRENHTGLCGISIDDEILLQSLIVVVNN